MANKVVLNVNLLTHSDIETIIETLNKALKEIGKMTALGTNSKIARVSISQHQTTNDLEYDQNRGDFERFLT